MGFSSEQETNATNIIINTLTLKDHDGDTTRQWDITGNSIYYGFLMPVAVIGNFLTLIVVGIILRHRRKHKCIPDMLLGALAACDLFSALFVHPFSLVALGRRAWPYGKVGCLFQSFCANLYFQVSFFVQVLVTVDRYFAVSKPLRYHSMCSFKRVALAVVLVTVFSAFMTSFSLFFNRHSVHILATWPLCLHDWKKHSIFRYVEMSIMGPVFVFGISIFVACNVSLIRILIEYQRKVSQFKYFSHTINQLEKASTVPLNKENYRGVQIHKTAEENDNPNRGAVRVEFNQYPTINDDRTNINTAGDLAMIKSDLKNKHQESGSSSSDNRIPQVCIPIIITTDQDNNEVDMDESQRCKDNNDVDRRHSDVTASMLLTPVNKNRKHQCTSEQNLLPLPDPFRSTKAGRSRSLSNSATAGARWLRQSVCSHVSNKQGMIDEDISNEIQIVVSTIEVSIEKCRRSSDEGKLQYIYKQLTKLARHLSRSAKRRQRELLFVKLVLLSATMYVVLWIPYLLTIVLDQVGARHSALLEDVAVKLMFLNAAINPFLYGLSRPNYRQGYCYVLNCIACITTCGLLGDPWNEDAKFHESRRGRDKKLKPPVFRPMTPPPVPLTRHLPPPAAPLRTPRSPRSPPLKPDSPPAAFLSPPNVYGSLSVTQPLHRSSIFRSRDYLPSTALQELFNRCVDETSLTMSSSIDYNFLLGVESEDGGVELDVDYDALIDAGSSHDAASCGVMPEAMEGVIQLQLPPKSKSAQRIQESEANENRRNSE